MADTYVRFENALAVQAAVRDFPRRIKELTRAWARGVAYDERDMIRRNIHNRSGRTSQYGVRVVEATQGEKGFFFIRLNQVVQWLDKGTGLYGPNAQLIYPRRASVLKFAIGGRTLFRRYVRGMRPQHVIGAAQSQMAGQMPARIRDLGEQVARAWKSG